MSGPVIGGPVHLVRTDERERTAGIAPEYPVSPEFRAKNGPAKTRSGLACDTSKSGSGREKPLEAISNYVGAQGASFRLSR